MILSEWKIKIYKKISITSQSKYILLYFSLLPFVLSQSLEIGSHFLSNKSQPFWLVSNNHDIYQNGSVINFEYSNNRKFLDYGLNIALPIDSPEMIFFNNAHIAFTKNNLFFSIGRKKFDNENFTLSTGSMIESLNALPIPKVSFGIDEYHEIEIGTIKFFLNGDFAHGWLDKGQYIKAPFLHEKSIYIKKNFFDDYSFSLGLVHKVIWGGETKSHGIQSSKFIDYTRVVFARPGSKNSIEQEKENALGNHLGIWDFSIEKEFNSKLIRIFLEHPFEDESSARWILNEYDGRYGISVVEKNSNILSHFVYEYINTMDQSGSEGASDSTYGWDNYYNHYIYQSGWTYNNKVLGNPLFTLGSNKGRYSDNNYIINNRIRAHHIGLAGSVSNSINFRMLLTYSENFGIFPDEDYYNSINETYIFDGGLIQRSALIEFTYSRFWRNLNLTIAYGLDSGELLTKTDSFVIKIDYKFKLWFNEY